MAYNTRSAQLISAYKKRFLFIVLFPLLLLVVRSHAYAQTVIQDAVTAGPSKTDSSHTKKPSQNPSYNINKQYDFADFTRSILHPKKHVDTAKKRSGLIVVPNVAANPTIGEQIGIKAVVGKKLGGDPNTLLSVGATSASITSKGIVVVYINHNIFTPGNKWNFQGNLAGSKSVSPDYGYGIGRDLPTNSPAATTLEDPNHKVYPIHSYFLEAKEKAYKEITKGLFIGAGMVFDLRRNIKYKDTITNGTPASAYNTEHGMPQDHYSANGFLFNIEYTTRDNQNRAYKGIYADAGIRFNQTWIGSTKSATQFTTDFRKYFSLSKKYPEMVLAFWNWGSYLLSGTLPYLELPGTAKDGAFKSGRGYTTQYFRGTKFNDTEGEFRFPILANKFLSGVMFGSLQSGNDEQGTKLFQVFEPGYGGGLRVLFNKATRTNLDLDYAFGKFKNKGFFLNLNEAF